MDKREYLRGRAAEAICLPKVSSFCLFLFPASTQKMLLRPTRARTHRQSVSQRWREREREKREKREREREKREKRERERERERER